MSHTKGPWAHVETDVGQIVVEDVNGWICEMAKWEGQDNRANAHLIAAAPDMLEALNECLEAFAELGIDATLPVLHARAAIKKARGGE